MENDRTIGHITIIARIEPDSDDDSDDPTTDIFLRDNKSGKEMRSVQGLTQEFVALFLDFAEMIAKEEKDIKTINERLEGAATVFWVFIDILTKDYNFTPAKLEHLLKLFAEKYKENESSLTQSADTSRPW